MERRARRVLGGVEWEMKMLAMQLSITACQSTSGWRGSGDFDHLSQGKGVAPSAARARIAMLASHTLPCTN